MPEGSPQPVLGNLVDPEGVLEEIAWAKAQAATQRAQAAPYFARTTGGLTAEDFEEYERELETWLRELEDLLIVEFVITNTGRAPAEDVEVILSVPFELRPREELPEMPSRPRDLMSLVSRSSVAHIPQIPLSKHSSPDSLIGPDVYTGCASSEGQAIWEVGKLYHGRPLFTYSDADEVGGLLISGRSYREHLSQVEGGVQLDYAVHAANVPDPLRGVVVLK